ncbi:MAG: adenosylcobinamide-GDP ribazoletransferase [Nitrospirae bacterium]|nr:adenosylcobinamide-GDP ribazoletransferase [Nitrospirota bacterium]
MIVRGLSPLRRAVQFLTILPVGRLSAPSPADLAGSMAWFPLVGAAIGGAAGAFGWFVGGGGLVSAVAALAAAALLTGALHLDGFVDTVDGLVGGRDREARLAIMRDSRAGAASVVAVWFLLSLKAVLLALLSGSSFVASLTLATGLGRWGQVLSSFYFPYARRDGGAGKDFVEEVDGRALLLATLCVIVIAGALAGWGPLSPIGGLGAAASVGALCVVSGIFFRRRIGGVTGDTLGAASEISELSVLALFAALR